MDYIKDRYNVGKLCKRIQNVDFEQEITTCVEDIQVCVSIATEFTMLDFILIVSNI